MYSINGNYNPNKKSNIIEHYDKASLGIDTEALKKESDEQGGTQTGEGNISYTSNTGGITQQSTSEITEDITEQSKSQSEQVNVVDIEKKIEISQEVKYERKATLEESVFKSKSTRDFDPSDMYKVKLCKDCDFENCDLKLLTGEYPDLTTLGVDVYGNNGISSFRVPPDFKLIVYTDINFKGKIWTINGPQNVGCLTHLGWDNKIASCKVINERDIAILSTECGFKGKKKEFFIGEYENQIRIGFFDQGSVIVNREEGYSIQVSATARGTPEAPSTNWAGKYEQLRDSKDKLKWKNGRPMYVSPDNEAVLRYERGDEFAGRHILGGRGGWTMSKNGHHRVAIEDSSTNMYPPLNRDWIHRSSPILYTEGGYFRVSSKEFPKKLPKPIENFSNDLIEGYNTGKFCVILMEGAGYTPPGWSDDGGLTWNFTNSSQARSRNAVSFNGSMWVSVGWNGVAYSNDGKNWKDIDPLDLPYSQKVNNRGPIHGQCVSWDGKKWIVGGDRGMITSEDGIKNWTLVPYSDYVFNKVTGIANNGGSLWVAVGSSGNPNRDEDSPVMAWSENGTKWYELELDLFTKCSSVEYNGVYWIATGEGANTFAYSKDGKIWVGAGKYNLYTVENYGISLAWNGNMWIAVGTSSGDDPNIYRSTNGMSWLGIKQKPVKNPNSISWDGEGWIVTGRGKASSEEPFTHKIAYSWDGIQWSYYVTDNKFGRVSCCPMITQVATTIVKPYTKNNVVNDDSPVIEKNKDISSIKLEQPVEQDAVTTHVFSGTGVLTRAIVANANLAKTVTTIIIKGYSSIGGGSTDDGDQNGAFNDFTTFSSVTIPASVTSIGNMAFWNCSNLTEVKFEEISNLKTIGWQAFWGTVALTSITLPASLTSISNGTTTYSPAFSSSGLKTIYFHYPNGMSVPPQNNVNFYGAKGVNILKPTSNQSVAQPTDQPIGQPPIIENKITDISSIKLGSSLKMEIYDDEFFSGDSKVFEGPIIINCLEALGWANRIKSFKLESQYKTKKEEDKMNLSSEEWLRLFNESPNKLIKRECQDCNTEHKLIIYKRLTSLEQGSGFSNDPTISNKIDDLKNYYTQQWSRRYTIAKIYDIWRCNGTNSNFSGWMSYRYRHSNGHEGNWGAPVNFNGNWYGYNIGSGRSTGHPPGGCTKLYDYKAIGVTKTTIDLKDLFLNNWMSPGNILNKDFELYNGDPKDFIDPVPSGDGVITNVKGSYGKNCGRSADRASWLGGMCNNKAYCDGFRADNSLGDPARGCVKNLDYSYSCKADNVNYLNISEYVREHSGNTGKMDCRASSARGPGSNPGAYTNNSSTVKKWSYCNYDDPGVGFPRDCGVTKHVPYQWNSISRGSAAIKFRYSIETINGWKTVYQSNEFVVPKGDKNETEKKITDISDEEKLNLVKFKELKFKDPKNNFYNGVNIVIDCQDGVTMWQPDSEEFDDRQFRLEAKNAKEFNLIENKDSLDYNHFAEFIENGTKLKVVREIDGYEWILDRVSGSGTSDLSHAKCGIDLLYYGYVYSNIDEYSFVSDNLPLIINVDEKMKLTKDYTISFWFYANVGDSEFPYLFYYDNEFTNLDTQTSNISEEPETSGISIGYKFNKNTEKYTINVETTNNILDYTLDEFINKWTHIAVTFEKDSIVKLYIDGEKVNEKEEKNTKPIGDYKFIFGRNIDGQMRNMAILKEALTDSYVKEFAKSHMREVPTIINPDGTLSEYNEESQSKVTDISALPVPGETLWHYVKDKNPEENKFLWSARIYNCLRGQQGCGTDFVDELGARYNAIQYLGDDDGLPPNCTIQTENEYSYKPFGGDISKQLHVLIEINATNDAHIALGEDTQHDGKHYEIVLGGWSNSKSVIRTKNQGDNLVEYNSKIFGNNLVRGLKYEYFKVITSNGTFDSSPFKTEILDGEVNYWWAGGQVLNSGIGDKVGLRITGYINIPNSANWQFRVKTDDGFRMKISDKYVINSWKLQGPTYHQSSPAFLNTGTYKLDIEWYEWGGYATMPLEWRSSGGYSPIPPEAFSIFGNKPEKFWISWDEGELKVGKEHIFGENEFMRLDMTDYGYKINNMMVSTGWGSTGIWKLYNGMCGKNKLSNEIANNLCNNPCLVYGKEGRGDERQSFVDSNMCDCSKGDDPFGCNERDDKCAKAINFDIGPTMLPAFKNSSSSSTFNSKEYKENIIKSEKNETKRTQSYSISSESIQLDSNTPIIPWKSKKKSTEAPYYSDKELEESKKEADIKLENEGGAVTVDNLITNVPEGTIDEPEVEDSLDKNLPIVSTPLPPTGPVLIDEVQSTRRKSRAEQAADLSTTEDESTVESDETDTDDEGSGISSLIILIILLLIIVYIIMRRYKFYV